MTTRLGIVLGLAAASAMGAGCATGRAFAHGEQAARAGEWDTAVAYYRQALASAPDRIDIKVALQRAMQTASQAHMARAAQLEAQDQLPGALAEYRLAVETDPSNVLAGAKSAELDRVIRQRIEDSRPKSPMETLREQARQNSPIPRLAVDPRMKLPLLTFNNTQVRQVIETIAAAAGINVTYHTASATDQTLARAYSVTLNGSSLQDALNQVLSANQLFFKVVDPHTIMIAADNQTTRALLEDQIVQTFYLSHAEAADVAQNVLALIQAVNTIAVRPQVTPNKATNSILVRASIPVMGVIEKLIRASDKPKAEVVIDVEILEIDRGRATSYGLNLSNYQLGFTFSPEAAPPNTTPSGNFPLAPPPFNLNTISQGVSMADFYMSVPTATIKALESDSRTKLLARTSLRGTEDKQVTLNLGDQVPVPNTTFGAVAAGGIANTPTTSFNLKDVGINVTMTPKVTYDNEIRIELTAEKSAKGQDVLVAGSSLPTFNSRKVATTLRLRDGEPNLIAGLLSEDERNAVQGMPGINKIPGLRSLLGGTEKSNSTTDIVMLITPHIVRGHELTAEDLEPIYVGTGQNFGLTGPPPLIAAPLSTEELMALAAAGQAPAATGTTPAAPGAPTAGNVATPPPAVTTTPPPASTPARNPNIVPVTPVGGDAPANPTPSRPASVTVTPPGQIQAGGGPYTMPVQVTDAQNIGSLMLTITYDPKVLTARTVTEGSFLRNGATTTFSPKIDADAGRIEISIQRPAGSPGVSGTGLAATLVFDVVSAGPANMNLTGSATNATGQLVVLQMIAPQIVVR